MFFIQKNKSLPSRNWFIEPIDLESGRRWLFNILLTFFIFATPLSLLVAVPIFLRERHFGLILIDLVLILTLVFLVIFRNWSLKIKGYISLIILFLLSASFIFTLGPHYARPAWLVMSAVLTALFFNISATVTIVSLNAVMLMVLYYSVGLGNNAWASTLSAPFSHWILFVVNISIFSLLSSLPLSFLLKRLDRALKVQQDAQSLIRQEAEKVETAYNRLQEETEERRRAEDSLRKSEELLSKLMDAIPDIVVRMDMEGKIKFINERGAHLAGYSTAEELIGMSMLSFIAPEDMTRMQENTRKMLDHPLGPQEYDFITKDGRRISLEVNGDLLRTLDGTPYGMVHICREITERKKVEEETRRAKEEWERTFDSVPDLIAILDDQHRIIRANKSMAKRLGCLSNGCEGMTCYKQIHGTDAPPAFCPHKRTLADGREHRAEVHEEHLGGDFLVSTTPLFNDQGKLIGSVHVSRDITERKRGEEALRESEERYRNILQNIDEGYYEVDLAGNLTFFNDSLCSMLGYSGNELMGMNNREYTDKENAEKLYQFFNQVYMTGVPVKSFDWVGIRKDGTKRFGEISVSPIREKRGEIIGFRGIARDITDRKQTEEKQEKLMTQLQQAQKMEAIGTLAGGIAHDFNNILTAIIGNAELALINITEKNPLHPYLTQVQESSRRAAELVKQILTFSRQKGQEPEFIQPGSIAKETLKMLRSTLPSTIEIKQHIENDPGLILADPTQIHQILMNLCTNAAHAMRGNGGLLEVLMDHINLTSEEVHHYSGLNPGSYLRVSVRDTGQGMTPEVMEHIFDPYFTTKKVGEGTGLGLAVVYGIVKKSNGDIKVYSKPGQGSLFEILLPWVEVVEDRPPKEELETIYDGTEHILLVDDEKDLVNIIQKMLTGLGYRVTSTLNSLEAFEIFKTRMDEFDAVITDMTMPYLTGTEFAKRIRKVRPDIPIILSTGYSELIDEEKSREIGIQALLMKPIGREILSKTVRMLLDKKKNAHEELIGPRH